MCVLYIAGKDIRWKYNYIAGNRQCYTRISRRLLGILPIVTGNELINVFVISLPYSPKTARWGSSFAYYLEGEHFT